MSYHKRSRTTKEDVISIARSQKTIKDIPITPLSATRLPGLTGPPSTTPSRNTSPTGIRKGGKKKGAKHKKTKTLHKKQNYYTKSKKRRKN